MAFVRNRVRRRDGGHRRGALVLPIIHQVTPVNLNVVRIAVTRAREEAVITRDRMRVDIEAEFFVRVVQKPAAVAAAASTLGPADPGPRPACGPPRRQVRERAAFRRHPDDHRRDPREARRLHLRGGGAGGRGADPERARARVGRDHRPRPGPCSSSSTPRTASNARGAHPPHRGDRDSPQSPERHRAERDGGDPVPQPRSGEGDAPDRPGERELAARPGTTRSRPCGPGKRTAIVREQVAREAQAQQSRIATERETAELEIERREAVEKSEIRAQEEAPAGPHRPGARPSSRPVSSARSSSAPSRSASDTRPSVAEIGANEDIERARVVSERQVREARIAAEKETETREIARGEQLETARIAADEAIEAARIAQGRAIEQARIEREKLIRAEQIASDTRPRSRRSAPRGHRAGPLRLRTAGPRDADRGRGGDADTARSHAGSSSRTARIAADKAIEAARIAQDQELDTASHRTRPGGLRSQQISQRQSTEEAEIAAQEEIERAADRVGAGARRGGGLA